MAERRPFLVTLYLSLSRLADPLLKLVHAYRVRSGKDDPSRGSERYGRPSLARPAGPLVWVHAASVGETTSVLPLIARLSEAGHKVLLTTVTRTSAQLAQKQLPSGALHQFAPFDNPSYWARFLEHWQPHLALSVESEIWPGCFVALAGKGIPLCIVNGRLSEKSARGWGRTGKSAEYLFALPALILAQSAGDAQRFRALGGRRVEEPGNLKFDALPDCADPAALSRLRAAVGARPLWLAALTHPGEDEIALRAHRKLLEEWPDLLLLLVPRHPERGDEVADLAQDTGFTLTRRSSGETPGADCQIYLGDTLGEMNLFYSLASVCFLGGSFAPVGGHNPVEPASFDVAIATGPNVPNARPVYRALWQAGGARKVPEPEALSGAVWNLLKDGEARARQVSAAQEIISGGRGALDRTLDLLGPYLAPSGSGGREN